MERHCKIDRKYNIDTNLIGKAGEYRVVTELILRNHQIYMPCVDNGIDIIVDDNIKIQIKCGQKQSRIDKKHDCAYKMYSFNFHSSKYACRHNPKPHKLENVDYVICWAIDDDEFYIIPADKIRGKTYISFTADEDKRTQIKWNTWMPYHNAWGLLDGEKIEDNKPTEELECKQCGYKWLPLTSNPSRCPTCNRRWYQKMYDHKCERCSGTWRSKVECPIRCQRCYSHRWQEEKPPYVYRPLITCVRCSHTWQPKVDKPERCPKCRAIRYLGRTPTPFHIKCDRCGYEWDSTKEKLKMCHKCHKRMGIKPKEIKELVTV